MDDAGLKPPCLYDDALAVLMHLRENGHVAYFAGGCVRDRLLGLDPKDWDVATDAPPERVRQLFRRSQAVGAAFGVILVHERESVVEVATFRTDVSYEDGRRPTAVQFTTAEADARRRDFTINGLFLDPIENRVIDFVGGRDDLTSLTLRAIGNPDERFAEDHLRLLRAVRFAARFGLTIESRTRAAIVSQSPKLARISPERIADELRRTFGPPTRAAAWGLLDSLGLLRVIMRHLPGPQASFDERRSIFLHTAPAEPISFGLALASATIDWQWQASGCATDVRPLLTREAVRATEQAMRRALRFSNENSATLVHALLGVAPLLAEEAPRLAILKRFLARQSALESIHLLRAFLAENLHAPRIATLLPELESLGKTEFAPAPFVTGEDLTAAGLAPGPVFKRVLDDVYDAQLETRVTTKEEAMTLAMRLAAAKA